MRELMEQDPAEVLRRAVRKMLPDVKFRNDMLKRMNIK